MSDTQATPQAPATTPAVTPDTQATPPVETVDRVARAVAALEAGMSKDETVPGKTAEVDPKADEGKQTDTKSAEATPTSDFTPSLEEKKPEVEETKLSQKIAEITKREADVSAKEALYKEKDEKFASFEQLKSDIKETPTKFLDLAGITFQELADAIIAEKSTPDPVKVKLKQLDKKIEEFEKKTQAEKDATAKAEEERLIKEQDEFIAKTSANYRKTLNEHIEKNKETFELVHSLGAQDLCWDIIETYWEKNEKIMPLEQACELAEKYLEERAEKMLTAKKLQAKKSQTNPTKPPATLTNSHASGSPERNDSLTHLNSDERASRAASLLRFDN